MNQEKRNAGRNHPQPGKPVCPARQRLAEAFARLLRIDLERLETDDPLYARPEEDRIVWRELLDLELQDIDERLGKIAGRG